MCRQLDLRLGGVALDAGEHGVETDFACAEADAVHHLARKVGGNAQGDGWRVIVDG